MARKNWARGVLRETERIAANFAHDLAQAEHGQAGNEQPGGQLVGGALWITLQLAGDGRDVADGSQPTAAWSVIITILRFSPKPRH